MVPIYVPEQHEPWAAVQTKKLDAVYLHLMGPKGRFTLGQLSHLGRDPAVDGARPGYDQLRLKFRSTEELSQYGVADFLKKHLAKVKKRD